MEGGEVGFGCFFPGFGVVRAAGFGACEVPVKADTSVGFPGCGYGVGWGPGVGAGSSDDLREGDGGLVSPAVAEASGGVEPGPDARGSGELGWVYFWSFFSFSFLNNLIYSDLY